MFPEEIYRLPEPVAVIIDKPWKDIPQPERDLLSKIIGAIESRPNHKLSLHAVQLITQPSLHLDQMPGRPENVIAFTALPAGIPMYEVIKTPASQLVAAEPLAKLISGDDAKKRLWIALRAQFGMGAKPS